MIIVTGDKLSRSEKGGERRKRSKCSAGGKNRSYGGLTERGQLERGREDMVYNF